MKKIIALALAATLAAPAFASEFYIGGDVGQNRTDFGGVTFKGTGFNVYGGYQLTPSIAFEAGYRSLGDDTKYDVKLEGSAVQASALYQLPLSSQVSVFGRLGVNRVEVKASVYGYSGKDDETKAFFGLGARYALNKQFGLRVEFQKPHSDVEIFSAGIDYRF
jgi:OmpA-OmpF porin, OOP family